MTSKGPSHVDPAHADPVDDPAVGATMRRRNLIGLTGVAGLAGAAASLLSSPVVIAAEDDEGDDQANIPTTADVALLEQALGLELAARDLYRSVSVDDETLNAAVGVMAENHEAFAQAIAGAAGISANTVGRSDEVYDAAEGDFSGDSFAEAAFALEQVAVATHTELVGQYESADAIELTASILVTEARHATVLAAVIGMDDPDELFGNEESALELGGNA